VTARKAPPRRVGGVAPKTSRIRSTDDSRIIDRRSPAQRDMHREVESQRARGRGPGPGPPQFSEKPRSQRSRVTGGIMPPKGPIKKLPPGPISARGQIPKRIVRGPTEVNPSTGATMRRGPTPRKRVAPYRTIGPAARVTPGPPRKQSRPTSRKKR
jgi:hypothetical protein